MVRTEALLGKNGFQRLTQDSFGGAVGSDYIKIIVMNRNGIINYIEALFLSCFQLSSKLVALGDIYDQAGKHTVVLFARHRK